MSEPRKAAIYDLGYQRYSGTRRPQRTRYQVIVRNLLNMAWRGWWRYKMPLFTSVATMIGIAIAIYFSRNKLFEMSGMDSQIRSMADAFIPRSFRFFGYSAMLTSMTVLASAISRDLQAGAFEFYFSRPVRPKDYMAGKLVGAFMLLAPMLLVAPLLLTIYRAALTQDMDAITETLPWIPKAIVVGFAATLAHACVALCFGALSKKPSHAIAFYAAFMFLGGMIINVIAAVTHSYDLNAWRLTDAIYGIAAGMFGAESLFMNEPAPGMWLSFVSLAAHVFVAIAIIGWRVRKAQQVGMGGG